MIKNIYAYFDANHAIKTHDFIISVSGGMAGVKDYGQIESVLIHIQNDEYYPDFITKLNHLVFSFVKFHAFNDGNKRSGIALGAYFLEINGFDDCIRKFQKEMENIVVWVAENKISKPLLEKIIESLIGEEDYSEELKLEIIDSLLQ